MIDVTIPLPEDLVNDAKQFGDATQRELSEALAEALELMWATISPVLETSQPISALSDGEVLLAANSKMEPSQNDRLGELQAKGKNDGLNAVERIELLALLNVYQTGHLRKSQGLAEAVKRGLLSPLSS